MKFNRFHLFRKNRLFFVILAVIWLALAAYSFYLGVYWLGALLILWGLLMPVRSRARAARSVKRHAKTNKQLNQPDEVRYRLDPERITVETVSADRTSSTELKWSAIYRVYETTDSYYIYISNIQALILPKKDIVSGSARELSQWMRDSLGKAYKVV
ncbi:YcxB family protein [Gorillibacterium timonense]|uniref:YcxB family protein n=1 Tax=Gorillibacterium timonense TaxID=1689269 RepID=UPI0011DD1050|nr:YcxB family protein [Gorillibacterium timonense]